MMDKSASSTKNRGPVFRWVLFGGIFVLLVAGIYVWWFVMPAVARVREEKASVGPAVTRLEAYNQFVQGRNNWAKRDEKSIRKAILFFKKAIEMDSTMAPAYSGMADCYTALGYASYEPPSQAFLPAESAARRALQIDSSLPDAHVSLGYIRFYYYWDWAGAEKEFLKAIQLNPHYEWTYTSYAYFLTARERFSEAAVAIEKALQINPLSAPINTDAGFSLYYSGHALAAQRPLQTALQINPRSPLAHLWLGRSYQQLRQYDNAIAQYQVSLSINRNWPPAVSALGNVYGVSGHPEKAREILDSLLAMQKDRFVTAYGVALVYGAMNDKDKAFEWLEKAFAERSNWLVWLRLDPRWAAMKSDPRFMNLLSRIGLTANQL